MKQTKSLIALVQLPPPIHGASLRNQEFVDYLRGLNLNDFNVFDIAGKGDITEIGKISIKKIYFSILSFIKIIGLLIIKGNNSIVYLTPSPGGLSLLRDALLVLLSGGVGVDVWCHFRAMGLYKLRNRFYGRIIRFCFKRANCIIMSKFVSYDIEWLFDPSNIHIVANGLASYSNKISTIKKDDSAFVFLHLSNLCKEKGVFDVLEAFKMMKVPAELWIVGPWFSEDERLLFNNYINLSNLQSRVKLIGPVYGEEKWDLFSRANAFVFPTKYEKECVPGVIMEAMSAALPSISYDRVGIPDLIEDNVTGFCVKEDDICSLAKSMDKLADNPWMACEYGLKGYERFHTNNVAPRIHKRLISLMFAEGAK